MADNYFDYLYGTNSKQEKSVADSQTNIESVAQDEAIGKPWTHRLTIYCANPSKEFIEGLKNGECVVAVYEKTKEADTEEKKEEAPSSK